MNKLNPAQLQAATHIDGALLILAGAGTGKTQTMISRLVYLITQVGIPAEQILVLTFTNKAAAAMNARAMKMLRDFALQQGANNHAGDKSARDFGVAHCGATLSTFHSWGMQFLQEYLAYNPFRAINFRIIDDSDANDIIKECTRKVLSARQNKPFFAQKAEHKSAKELAEEKEIFKEAYASAKYAIAQAKSALIAPNDEQNQAILREYEMALKQANLCDFDDLILLPIAMLEQNLELKALVQNRWQYVMVDEYQDTNTAQLRLLKLLVNEAQNIVVVGDDDQSIYSFRHARVENILDFAKDFKGAKIIRLEQNYRCSKTILRAANELIAHNHFRHGKTLFSELDEGDEIELLNSQDEIICNIKNLLKSGVKAHQIAILYRLNMLGNFLEPKLISAQIAYRVVGQIAFFLRSEIKLILAYVRLWLNPLDNQAFLRVINAPRRGFGEAAVLKLKQIASKEQNPSLFECLRENLAEFKNSAKLRAFFDLFDSLGSFALFSQKLKALDLGLMYDDYAQRSANIAEFFNILSSTLGDDFSHEKIFEFLNQIALANEKLQQDKSAISLMSIHAAKGLEFDYVFIAGAESKYMPSPQASSAMEFEEERRLMYVAITRAKKRLWLQFESAPSEYLEQMKICPAQREFERTKTRMRAKRASANDGALINDNLAAKRSHLCFHASFGVGIIEHVLGANKLMIQFAADAPGKIRTLSADFVQISNQRAQSNMPTPSEIDAILRLFRPDDN